MYNHGIYHLGIPQGVYSGVHASLRAVCVYSGVYASLHAKKRGIMRRREASLLLQTEGVPLGFISRFTVGFLLCSRAFCAGFPACFREVSPLG